MRFKGFIGPTYKLRTVNVDCQRCVNLYPEIDELQTANHGETGALMSTPGLTKVATLGTGPVRGVYYTSTGRLAVVSGNTVYRVESDWSHTVVGTILSSSGRVSMSDNGTQLIIVDGTNTGFIVSLVTGVMTQITAAGFRGANTVSFQDGYFMCNNPDTGQWYISGLYDGFSWDALDFATAEGQPDNLVGLISNLRQVWLFGTRTTEVWWNTGAQDFPFGRIDGAYIEFGCASAASIAKVANSVCWLGEGPNAKGVVWMAEGYQPKRISNHSVEEAIRTYGDLSATTAYSYQQDGHVFYCLNFTNANTTWVFDVVTGQWHERAYLGSDGNFERARPDCYALAYGYQVLGDYQNGNLYVYDFADYTDDGNPLPRMRRAPHISNGMNRMFFNRLQLDIEGGVGTDGSTTAQGYNPRVMLRWSDDFGHSWSPYRMMEIGKIGDYRKRINFWRLGQARDRVFEVYYTDPTRFTLCGAELYATPGSN